MLKLIASLFLLVALLGALPASACEQCKDYFDYQSLRWCWYCQASGCGYFNCSIGQLESGAQICYGDDAGCFEVGAGCSSEPCLDPTGVDCPAAPRGA